MSKRPTIRFSIDPDQKTDIEAYAKAKGFDNPSNLARVALFNYISRNKMTESQRCRAEKADTGNNRISNVLKIENAG
jgi:hypothetical protein